MRMAANREGEIVDRVRTLATRRQALGLGSDSAENLWNEYSVFLARDQTFGKSYLEDELRLMCDKVLDDLPDFERQLLVRTTDEYRELWREDAPEPDDADARRWFIGDMLRSLASEAIDYGQDLLDGTDDVEDEA
jgi:hypothetical protein